MDERWHTSKMNRKRTQNFDLAVNPGVALAVALVSLVSALPTSSGVNHDPCSTTNLTPGGIGSRGNITSPMYPDSMPVKSSSDHNCRMVITACAACKVQIAYNEFIAPPCHKEEIPIGSCVPHCDHLLLFEPDYPEETTQYVFGDATLNTYTTVSNRVTLIACMGISNNKATRRFRLGYQIQEKKRTIRGHVGGPGEVGYFTSPNFPHGYSLHNEVFTFLLENDDPNGLVRLGFDDWNLSPNSRLTVYFHNATHPDGYLTRMGRGERPFVLSSGPSLFIKFETGEDLYAIPYIGFKASYEFVSEPYWPDKPYTVHDEYFYSRYGGQFSFNTQRCWPGDRVDCIWVVTKYNDHNHDQVALNVQSFYIVPGLDYLEIRSGNSSDGLLLGQYEHSNLTGTQFVSRHGFYLRLRATCSNTRQFHAVFASFTNATNDGCTYYYHFQCGNSRCIAKSLVCDGIDHCSDGTDEIGCTTPNPSTRKECITTYVCRNGMGWYCLTDRCNGHNDCEDGTDEFNCWNTVTPWTEGPYLESYYRLGTYLPVGLVAVLLVIIACIVISCCARRKRNLMRRHQHTSPNGTRRLPSISASLPGRGRRLRSASETHLNINVEIQHYPDSPPPYEEAISQSQSTYSGIHNMAFTMSDSSDHLMTPPPPYSPRDENPYPPPSMASRGLYIPRPSGSIVIGMPPSGAPYSPDGERPPLTGSGDLAGDSGLAQVHGSGMTTSNRRSRDPGRRRTRHPRQGGSRTLSHGGTVHDGPQGETHRGGGGGGRDVTGSVGRLGHTTSSDGLGLAEYWADSAPLGPPPPPPRRRNSSTSSPIQNFVQNLMSRAVRQTPVPPPQPTYSNALQLTSAVSPSVQNQTVSQVPPEDSTTNSDVVADQVLPPSDPPSSEQPTCQVASGIKDNDNTLPTPSSRLKSGPQCVGQLIHSPSDQSDKALTEDKNTSSTGDSPTSTSGNSPAPGSEDSSTSGSGNSTISGSGDSPTEVAGTECDTGDTTNSDPSDASALSLTESSADMSEKALTLEGADNSMTFV